MKKNLCFLLALLMLAAFCSCGEGVSQGKEYEAIVNGVEINIDAKAEPILESLGAHTSYDQSPTCAFEGFDKVYGYGGFEIETYTLDDVDYIRAVHLLSDEHETKKGISVGDSSEDVEKAYGEPSSKTATAMTYQGGGMKLTFLLRDGKVTHIRYLKIEEN